MLAKIPKLTSLFARRSTPAELAVGNGGSARSTNAPQPAARPTTSSQINPLAGSAPSSSPTTTSNASTDTKAIKAHLKQYLLAVAATGCSEATLRNYKSDINQFCDFVEDLTLSDFGNKPKLLAFAHSQRDKGLKEASIKRKLVSLTQFKIWLKQQGLLKSEVPLTSDTNSPADNEALQVINKQAVGSTKPIQSPDKQTRNQLRPPTSRLTLLLNLLALVLLLAGLGYFGYQQFGQAIISMAYPSTPTPPNRILSYQGRLTNTAQTPIAAPTNMLYKLFDADTGGTELWSSNTCSIDPDQDGIFVANLGAGAGAGSDDEDCGGTIPDSVFTENSNVWLEVTVASETLTPRQPIRTVAYALNAETLQGLPPAEVATADTILMMNTEGEVVLGTTTPIIKTDPSSTGLTIESQQITIQTSTGSNGDIILAPDGAGIVDIQGDLNVSGTSTLVGNTYITSPNTLIFGGTTALGESSSPTDSGAYLIGVNDEFTYSNSNNVQAVLKDLDTAIGVVGSPPWSSLTAPAANLSLNHGVYTTAFDWATGTGTNNLFSLTTANSSNGTGSLLNIQTGTSSTVSPLRIRAGATEALFVDNAGQVGIGTNAPNYKFDLTTSSSTRGINISNTQNTTNSIYGIYASTNLTDATEVASGYGGYFINTQTNGYDSYGIYAESNTNSPGGSSYGVYGKASVSSEGIGVFGEGYYGGIFAGEVAGVYGTSNQATSWGAGGSFETYRDLSSSDYYLYGLSASVLDISDTSGGVSYTYGNDISVSRQGATGGTINTFGQNIVLNTDNAGAGVHTAYGLNVSLDGNADYNYAAIFNGGLVGIGTSTPTETLDITGNLRLSGAFMPNNQAGTSGYVLTSAGAGNAPTWTDPSTFSGSSVWSDLTNPTANLSLSHGTYTTAFSWATGTGTNNLFSLTTANSSNGTGSLLNVQTGTSSTVSPLRVRAGNTEALFVDNTGNVGVGLTNPDEKLTVNGSVNAEMYYDSTNKNYFLDPAAAGTALRIAGDALIGGSATASGNVTMGGQLQVGRFASSPTAVGAGAMIFNTTTQTQQCYNGSNWYNCGGTLYSNTNNIADGSYITVAHNLATNDLLSSAWVDAQGNWKLLDASYKPAIAWEGKNTQKGIYRNSINSYLPNSATGAVSSTLHDGYFFDTFEDGTKTDSANTTVSLATSMGDLGSANFITLNQRLQAGRAGLMGGQTLNSSTNDNDGNAYLGSNTVNSMYYYDRGQDSIPEVLVELGIDPNWYNGVTLSTAISPNQYSQAGILADKNPNLTTSYNGSLVKAAGTMATPRTIYLTIKTPTTFDWNDYNGNSATNVTITPGIAQALAATGVSVTFSQATYNVGDVFAIASWYVEAASSTRGAKRQFPERSYIVANGSGGNGHIDIIDADTQKLWMRFSSGASNYIRSTANRVPRSITMLNGKLYFAQNDGANTTNGIMERVNFDTDSLHLWTSASKFTYSLGIASRNAASTLITVSNGESIVANYPNDVAAAVIPNHPTREITVSGWGYFSLSSTNEIVSMPYKFNSAPNITITSAGHSGTTAPNSPANCTNSSSRTVATDNATANLFTARLSSADATNYQCYTWTATGTVSPKQFVAITAGPSGSDGGTTIINETDGTKADILLGSQIADAVWQNKVAIANNTLYTDQSNSTANNSTFAVYQGLHGLQSETTFAAYRTNWYLLSSQTGASWSTNGPVILGSATGTNQVNSLHAVAQASTNDSNGNVIYVGTAQGLTALNEVSGSGNMRDSYTEANGSVKYYTQNYISEDMIGDIRGMWPLASGTSLSAADASIKGSTLGTTGSPTATSGVRGVGVNLNGSSYMSCTDAACGGTSKLDSTGTTWSYGAWYRTSSATTNMRIMDKWGTTTAHRVFMLGIGSSAGTLSASIGNGSTTATVTDVATSNDGNWHHAVVTYDGVKLSLFRDGALVSQTPATLALQDGTANFGIGANATDTASNYWNGQLDEPFVTATTLTPSQVKNMYQVGYRALQSHSTALGGGAADTNQKLNFVSVGTSIVGVAQPDRNNQYLYVGLNSATVGGLSKIQLNSDTNVKTYRATTNVPAGGPLLLDEDVNSLAVGHQLEAVGSATLGVRTMGADDYATATSGNFVSNTYTLPKNVGSAVLWASPVMDSNDGSNTLTVQASNDGGSNYVTCTLVGTDSNYTVPEREYACTFATMNNQLKVRFQLARGSTRTNTYLVQYGISWLGETGFRMEQADNNNVRLYNLSGETQNLKLNVTGASTAALANPWTDAGSYLYPTGFESIRVYDAGGSSYLNLSHTGSLAQLGYNGTTVMSFTSGGNVGIGNTSPGSHRISVTGTAGLSTGTAWTNTSDFRLKDIESELVGSALDKVMALRPVSFRWNELHHQKFGSSADKLNLGFIAQEVEEILPHMITTDEDGYKWYNPSGFEALLTAGIQEQQAQILALEHRLQLLTNEPISLSTTGEITLYGASPTTYTVATPTGTVSNIAAFADLVVARIRAGYIHTRELLAQNLTVTDSLTAPTIHTEQLSSGDGKIELLGDLTISDQLEVTGPTKLAALTATTIEADRATFKEATITGTLTVDQIKATSIEANLISGLQERLSEQIAATLNEPTLLAQLFDSSTQQTEEYLAQIQAEMSAYLSQTEPSAVTTPQFDDDLALMADTAFINTYFQVNQSAYIQNVLKVGEALLLGDHSTLTANYLNFAEQFNIQPSGQGRLSLMADMLVLDDSGLATINASLRVAGSVDVDADLAVRGTLLGNMIAAANRDQNIRLQLAQTDLDPLTGDTIVKEQALEFVNENQIPVATVSAAGDLTLTGALRLNQTADAPAATDPSAGQATLVAGQTQVVVTSALVETGSMIYITPLNSTNNQVLYVKNKLPDSPFTPENEGQFTVAIDFPLGHNVTFNWWIVQTNTP